MIGAHDCGFAINPLGIEGQVEGSISGGMGQALYEDTIRSEGLILNPSFLNYKIPTALDMPQIDSVLLEPIDPLGPFGAKGVSEGTQVPTCPAIANAITNACKVIVRDLPISPEKMLRMMEGE